MGSTLPYLNHVNQFKSLVDRTCDLAESYGLKMKGYHSNSLPLYRSLSTEQQKAATQSLSLFLQTMECTIESGSGLNRPDQFLWHALSALQLLPLNELFQKISSTSAIEIYDLQGVQLWRNFECLRCSSYTLEEIHSIEWFKRLTRDPQIQEICMTTIQGLLTGVMPELFTPSVPKHRIQETCSAQKLELEIQYEVLCRLKDRHGNLAAWLVATKAEVVDRTASVLRDVSISSSATHNSTL